MPPAQTGAARRPATSARANCSSAPGVGFVDGGAACAGRDEAQAAAGQLGYPVVLKALGMLHKSDAGGVVVGHRRRPRELDRAVADIRRGWRRPRCLGGADGAAAEGVELIVGARRDPRFGAGGDGRHGRRLRRGCSRTWRSGWRRSTDGQAAELLRSLRGAPLLAGARGRPAVDVAAAARAAAALSRLAAERPGHRRDRGQPAAGDRRRRAGLDARIIPGGRRSRMLVDGSFDGQVAHRHRRRQRDGPGDGPRVRPARRGGGGRRAPAGAAGRDGRAGRGRRAAGRWPCPTDVRDPEQVDAHGRRGGRASSAGWTCS